jgi:alkaline phosphatase
MLTETQVDVIMGGGGWVFDAPQEGLHEVADQAGYTVLRGATELSAWDPVMQPRVLALFQTDFVPGAPGEGFLFTPALERTANAPDPTQATMTKRAIERLSQDPDGFFLFSEDETFDVMGHRGVGDLEWANRAYPVQALAFDAAVAVAIDWVLEHSSFDETLIVVLADHDCGGYHFDHAVGPSSGAFSMSGVHTRIPIEVYALGPGSDSIDLIQRHADTYRLLTGTLP